MTKSDKFIAIISHYLLQGTSSVALAWSGTFDDLIGGHISTYFQENAPMGLTGLAPYPDIFATVLVLLLSGNVEALIRSHRVITKQHRAHRHRHNHRDNPAHSALFKRGAGIRGERVNHDKQDLYCHQHPGAGLRGDLRLHQGRHLQLANLHRGTVKLHVNWVCSKNYEKLVISSLGWPNNLPHMNTVVCSSSSFYCVTAASLQQHDQRWHVRFRRLFPVRLQWNAGRSRNMFLCFCWV